MELTRKQVIEELQKMLDYCSIRQDSTPERKQALVYAISSLKTDEAYQLMYEGGEIFTKVDMVDMLEEISLKFDEQYYINRHQLHDDSLNRGLEQGQNIIQLKINELDGKEK